MLDAITDGVIDPQQYPHELRRGHLRRVLVWAATVCGDRWL